MIQYSHPGCSYSTTPFLYGPSDHSDFIHGFFLFAWAPPMDSPTGISPIGTASITLNNLMLLGGVWYGVFLKWRYQFNIQASRSVEYWNLCFLGDPSMYTYIYMVPSKSIDCSKYRYYNSNYIDINNGNYRLQISNINNIIVTVIIATIVTFIINNNHNIWSCYNKNKHN